MTEVIWIKIRKSMPMVLPIPLAWTPSRAKGHYYLADNIADNVSLGYGIDHSRKNTPIYATYMTMKVTISECSSVCRNREDCHSLRRWRGY